MNEQELQASVAAAEEDIQKLRKRFFRIRRFLDTAETKLVDAREVKRRAEEALYEHQRTKVGEFSLDDFREAQIEDYKTRMQASLKSIAHEPPIPYKTMADLDTIEAWPKSRYGHETDSNLDD